MRIAVTYENGEVFQHFGHATHFKVYDSDGEKITAQTVISTNGSGHSALADILKQIRTNVLICGGIGGGARNALDAANIEIYGGVKGDADKAVEAFLAGKLEYDPAARCDHHDSHHGDDHVCGEHGCGEHDCGGHH
ncbi:MAG: dinitrogenase iron-molybdenum cofactor biosynthesis protein [Ruminococcaceae bacterium]|nr:dinitrogenase iron-molybdenum cofactor biosynthesis protein [Oscillospiraceae bacterium]